MKQKRALPESNPRESGKPVVVEGLSRFVTTKGGLYCFIPSITAIKWMAANGGSANPWTLPSFDHVARTVLQRLLLRNSSLETQPVTANAKGDN